MDGHRHYPSICTGNTAGQGRKLDMGMVQATEQAACGMVPAKLHMKKCRAQEEVEYGTVQDSGYHTVSGGKPQ